jgi:hypothetical protein
MKEHQTAELVGVIEKNLRALNRLRSSFSSALANDVRILGRRANAALIVAGLLDNYYTCRETTFLRISHFFENELSPDHWHSDLLEKMTIHIEGVRIAAVSEYNQGNLIELLKFRHFRRYYFEVEYDWDRLDFLLRKLERAHSVVQEDFARFLRFLRAL